MYYVVKTNKTFNQAATDVEAAVKRNGFGVLHIHDLAATLENKGIPFHEKCKIFEVCNPVQAAKVMYIDMRLNMALPCRISVFTDGNDTKIGMIKPGDMLSTLSDNKALGLIAKDVEEKTIQIINESK